MTAVEDALTGLVLRVRDRWRPLWRRTRDAWRPRWGTVRRIAERWFGWTGWLRRPWTGALLLLVGTVGSLVMRQASTLLASVQTEGSQSFRAGAYTGFPWPPTDDSTIVAAFDAWARAGSKAGIPGLVESWVHIHQWLDLFVFIPSFTLLLVLAVRRWVPRDLHWVQGLPYAYAIADVAETAWTLHVARSFGAVESSFATHLLAVLAFVKWSLLLTLVAVVAFSAAVRRKEKRLTPYLGMLWRLRVQVTAVGLLALMVAAPLGGPLEQVPDVLRSAVDEHPVEGVAVPALLLLLLGVGVWTSGHLIVWEKYTWEARTDDSARRPWRSVAVLLAALLVGGLTYLPVLGLHPSPGVWGPALLVLGWLVLDLLARAIAHALSRDPSQGLWEPPGPLAVEHRETLSRLVDGLAVAPLTVISLGAVRSFSPQVLLVGAGGANGQELTAWTWLVVGALGALATVPVWYGVRRVTRLATAGSGIRQLRRYMVLTLLVGVVALGLGVVIGLWPGAAARHLRAHGVLATFLALLATGGGLLQWQAEHGLAARLPRALGMARTPWFVVLAVTVGLVGALDDHVGYHAPRTLANRPQPPVTVNQALDQWRTAAIACRRELTGSRPTTLPLVLVAAPGGGARAAYWTALAMRGMARMDDCAGGSIFAATGASGGSVGLAIWSVDKEQTARSARRLTSPDALAADVAAMLFRDAPRAAVGIHPYGVDRAAVEEDAWTRTLPALRQDFSTVGGLTLATGSGADQRSRWSPELLLGGTDLSTGCKVLMTNLRLSPDQPVSDCRVPPTYSPSRTDAALIAGTVNSRLFSARPDCRGLDRRAITTATAALLSARFPFVSPTGQLPQCVPGASDPADRLYVGDGGYLENSGLHSLLALWADMRGWVEDNNRRAGLPRVLPVAVVLDNHFRSQATQAARPKLDELLAPVLASRRGLLEQGALEQAARAVFTGPVPGVARTEKVGRRWFVIAPTDRPQVAAPLGWSLSRAARASLHCQLDPAFDAPRKDCDGAPADTEGQVAALRALLGASSP